MKNFPRLVLCVFSIALAWLMPLALAAPPQTINYQGVLTDPGGTPINVPVVMTFRLYNAASGGAALWTETQLSVNVVNGKFDAVLGSVPASPLTLPFDVPYWLTVAINADAEMTPRQPLASSAYAFRAATADTVSSVASITGAQITGAITTATIPSAQITGAINAATATTATTAGALSGTVAGAQVTGAILQGGNTLGAAMSVGTQDNNTFNILANNVAAFRVVPTSTSPNLIGGYTGNSITAGVAAAVVSGGGSSGQLAGESCGTSCANRVTDYGGSVGGGVGNQAGDAAGTTIDARYATVGGGFRNTASDFSSTVGGGINNTASGYLSTVGGGAYNTASGASSTVGGGYGNKASSYFSTVGGGEDNTASGSNSFAAGTRAKTQTANASPYVHDGAFVWSDFNFFDFNSTAANQFSARATGGFRFVTAIDGAGIPTALVSIDSAGNLIGGSASNFIAAGVAAAVVSGGGSSGTTTDPITFYPCGSSCANRVTDHGGSVGGGVGNQAGDAAGTSKDAPYATVGGGVSNVASGDISTIGGGRSNTASGVGSTIGGGRFNTASGVNSTVGGGLANTASGNGSFAAGTSATTQTPGAAPVVHDGAFVWSDAISSYFNSTAANEFSARATGGFRFVTAINIVSGVPTAQVSINSAAEMSFGAQTRQMLNLWNTKYGIGVQNNAMYSRSDGEFQWFRLGTHSDTTGDAGAGGTQLMSLSSGGLTVNGTFVSASDRNAKENFAAIDPRAVLEKVVALPLESWNYRHDEKKVRHLGPMAQDFFKAFAIGPDDKHIATVDEGGVALAAIQGLNLVVNEKDAEIKRQRVRIEILEEALLAIQSRLGMR